MECQGSAHPARLICLWGAVVVTLGADASPEPPPYDALPRYSRQILDEALGPADSLAEGGGNEAFQAASVRSWSYIAPGLLLRNHGEDRERACRILRWVLGHQFTDPAAPEYGVWKTSPRATKIDQNWREFVGCALIVVHAYYRDRLPEDLVSGIETALRHAAEGARRRDVGADYSNIAILSAVLMEYTGSHLGAPDIEAAGQRKAQEVFDLHERHGTFSEFNSTTYYGVDLMGLAMWRELACSEEMRRAGRRLGIELWGDIADFYHAGFKTMAGPYFRAYGMDMMRHNTPAGLWIALALNEEKLAPFPRKQGAKFFEIHFASAALILGVHAPEATLGKLDRFDEPRQLERTVFNRYGGEETKKVTATLDHDWMMGGVAGHRRPWNQIHTGTVHWRIPGVDRPGWMVVPGTLQVDVRVDGNRFEVFAGGLDEDKDLVFFVHAPGTGTDAFGERRWLLPGITFAVETELGKPEVRPIDRRGLIRYERNEDRVDDVLEVRYTVSGERSDDTPLVSLVPVDGRAR